VEAVALAGTAPTDRGGAMATARPRAPLGVCARLPRFATEFVWMSLAPPVGASSAHEAVVMAPNCGGGGGDGSGGGGGFVFELDEWWWWWWWCVWGPGSQ
jgi:hypothetical protein